MNQYSKDFFFSLLNNEDYIVSDGQYWRDKKGQILAGLEIR